MEKNIEDYLHFYFGCKVEYGYKGKKKIGQITGKVELYGWEIFDAGASFDIYHKVRSELIKPILYPLSDMSDEECETYNKLSATMRSLNKLQDQMKTEAALTVYLLSKSFDLFGLIESGLAIDKNKLTEKV